MVVDAALTMLILVLVVPISGGLMAVTPYLMPKRECFAVTVPETAWQDEQLRGFKRKFTSWCAVLTVVCTAVMACATAPVMGTPADSSSYGALVGALIGSTLAVTLIPFCFMLHFRKKVMALKRERGWFAPRQEATALVVEEDVPHAISLAWNLLYVPVLLIIVAIGVVAYPSMPDMIPMHADFAGNVNDYEPKSIGVVFGFPVLTVLFLMVCFIFSHWMMIRSKRPTNPGAPVTSALAYGMFARAQSIFLLVTGLLLSAGIGIGFMLSSAGVFGLGEMALVIVLLSLFIVVGAVALSVGYGQAGSRLFSRMEAAGGEACLTMPADDDEHWKLGVFYFNPGDSSLWVCERFGVGWTMNFARPAAWAFAVGFALVTVVFIVVITSLVG